mgnify:CR=1 FL=1
MEHAGFERSTWYVPLAYAESEAKQRTAATRKLRVRRMGADPQMLGKSTQHLPSPGDQFFRFPAGLKRTTGRIIPRCKKHSIRRSIGSAVRTGA